MEGMLFCKNSLVCLLCQHFLTLDRTTPIGKMIDSYLQSKADMDDRAIHLLFSANRWELA